MIDGYSWIVNSRRFIISAWMALSFGSVVAQTALKPSSMELLDNSSLLQPGYTISIRILEDKKAAEQQRIAVTGEVQVPYVGLVMASGRTCRELAFQIQRKLTPEYFKEATVIVTLDAKDEPPRRIACFPFPTITVFGKVVKSGKYDIPSDHDLTVSSQLKRAGGHTSEKKIPVIRIIRHTPRGEKTFLVNAKAILVEHRSEYDLFLRAYDVMIVE